MFRTSALILSLSKDERRMAAMTRRHVRVGMATGLLLAGLGFGSRALDKVAAAAPTAPRFEVDPLWPKPLPNHWILGMTIGVSADAQDHIWIIHRQQTLEPKEVYATTDPPGAS